MGDHGVASMPTVADYKIVAENTPVKQSEISLGRQQSRAPGSKYGIVFGIPVTTLDRRAATPERPTAQQQAREDLGDDGGDVQRGKKNDTSRRRLR